MKFVITQCKAQSVVNIGNNDELCAMKGSVSVPDKLPLWLHNQAMGES
jgi:hypothetical protein